MKTLSVELPEDIYERAERRSAAEGITLPAQAGQLLREFATRSSARKAADSAVRQAVYDQLDELWNECRQPNWDAHGAEPVQQVAWQLARRFLETLPSEYPLPSVGAEPDGHLTLEWYRATNWLLSVSVSPEGVLHYAALLGDEDPRGSCRFDGVVPETILYWIRRVAPP